MKKYIDIKENHKEMYESLMLLPSFYDYNSKNIKTLSNIFLCMNNSEAFINLITMFSGETIKIPKIEDVENILRLLMSYNYIMKHNDNKFIFLTNQMIKEAFKIYNINFTKENINSIKKIDDYFNQKLRK